MVKAKLVQTLEKFEIDIDFFNSLNFNTRADWSNGISLAFTNITYHRAGIVIMEALGFDKGLYSNLQIIMGSTWNDDTETYQASIRAIYLYTKKGD